jgi:hypothetical protein
MRVTTAPDPPYCLVCGSDSVPGHRCKPDPIETLRAEVAELRKKLDVLERRIYSKREE